MINKWLRKQKEKYVKFAMKRNAKCADDIDEIARRYGMENDQEFLNWQDSLNEVSVR